MKRLTNESFMAKQINETYLLTNKMGEIAFLGKEEYNHFINDLSLCSEETITLLKSRFFVYDEQNEDLFEKITTIKYDTKFSYLYDEEILLMVVPTISCNCNCVYCQVSSKKEIDFKFDMSLKDIFRFCDFVFALPHKSIKIEFQGGEPTVRFDLIELIVRRVNYLNKTKKKFIDYVICTNLMELNSHEIKVIKKYDLKISTSLDGWKEVHNQNRPSSFVSDPYSATIRNIELLRSKKIYPSALVTITAQSLHNLKLIIDTYVKNGFSSIFLRPLNNYGCAFRNEKIQYSQEEFLKEYKKAILYILEINKKGCFIREEYFAILLRKILTPFNDGFVDMQNPCALGRMCMIVTQNGDIFPSDESRMISEMGDSYWKMGNLNDRDLFEKINERQKELSETGTIDSINKCKKCVYSPFCYVDPIKNYYIKKYSNDEYCGIKEPLFDFIFGLIYSATDDEMSIFRRWANV